MSNHINVATFTPGREGVSLSLVKGKGSLVVITFGITFFPKVSPSV